jgi:hypothetical protein
LAREVVHFGRAMNPLFDRAAVNERSHVRTTGTAASPRHLWTSAPARAAANATRTAWSAVASSIISPVTSNRRWLDGDTPYAA